MVENTGTLNMCYIISSRFAYVVKIDYCVNFRREIEFLAFL